MSAFRLTIFETILPMLAPMVDDDFWSELEGEIQGTLRRNGIYTQPLPHELREIIENFLDEVRIFWHEQEYGKFGHRLLRDR